MRVKLMKPEYTTEIEHYFIEKMKYTHDEYGLKESWLVNHINMLYGVKLKARHLRTFKEKFNNNKYIDYPSTWSIYTIGGLYRRYDNESRHKVKMDEKSNLDFLCAIQDRLNYLRKHDDGSGYDQMTMMESLLELNVASSE